MISTISSSSSLLEQSTASNHHHNHNQHTTNDTLEWDQGDAAVRALAAKLAPALQAADDLLAHLPEELQRASEGGRRTVRIPGHNDNDHDDDDDDDLDEEETALLQSEELLRQELATAHDLSSLFERMVEAVDDDNDYDDDDDNNNNDDEDDDDTFGLDLSTSDTHVHHTFRSPNVTLPAPLTIATSIEADVDEDDEEDDNVNNHTVDGSVGGWSEPGLAPRRGRRPTKTTTTTPTRTLAQGDVSTWNVPLSSSTSSSGSPRRRTLGAPPVTPSSAAAAAAASDTILTYNHVEQYTQQHHFDYLNMFREETGGWYSVDLTKHVIQTKDKKKNQEILARIQPCGPALKEYCLAIPDTKLKHLFIGVPDSSHRKPVPSSATTTTTKAVASLTSPSSSSVAGLPESSSPDASSSDAAPAWPVRTLTLRIRPDVLCGAVMDAVQSAVQELIPTTSVGTRIRKRQGGHLQAIIGAVSAPRRRSSSGNSSGSTASSSDTGSDDHIDTATEGAAAAPDVVHYPPFSVDVQLTTFKSDECQRMLLIRIYHLSAQEEQQLEEDFPVAADSDSVLVEPVVQLEAPIDTSASWHLRESCALIQRIESVASNTTSKPKRIRPVLTPGRSLTRHAMQAAVSQHFRQHYRACPSVKDGAVTLPALNNHDWPVIQASWRLVQSIWEELETRDLTYTSLALSSRFGAFPSLPTLDVHFCSQIRRLSREGMIVQLLKSASELEDYAREAEYACANMISLLQPTFEAYGIEPPSLPKPKPLTSYPLEFTPPQQACPPWGQKVMEALNQVQAWTSDAGKAAIESGHNSDAASAFQFGPLEPADGASSLELAAKSVQLVFRAFQIQDDEEKGARLGRKNVQVMDRLAKMQEHQQRSIQALREAYLTSEKAAKAAEDFAVKSKKKNQVPLLKWSIVVGGSTGTCMVSADYILFVTQLIPVIGGSTTKLWKLREVEFSVQEGSASLLNPLPTVISVKREGSEVYSFRPSVGGSRLVSFLDILKNTVRTESSSGS